ncbi:MAG: hypothetical protein KKE20_00175 [Nanoarchaeota archaeon]|nr:hypothetical protein [Nanoarchaeota archaeon]
MDSIIAEAEKISEIHLKPLDSRRDPINLEIITQETKRHSDVNKFIHGDTSNFSRYNSTDISDVRDILVLMSKQSSPLYFDCGIYIPLNVIPSESDMISRVFAIESISESVSNILGYMTQALIHGKDFGNEDYFHNLARSINTVMKSSYPAQGIFIEMKANKDALLLDLNFHAQKDDEPGIYLHVHEKRAAKKKTAPIKLEPKHMILKNLTLGDCDINPDTKKITLKQRLFGTVADRLYSSYSEQAREFHQMLLGSCVCGDSNSLRSYDLNQDYLNASRMLKSFVKYFDDNLSFRNDPLFRGENFKGTEIGALIELRQAMEKLAECYEDADQINVISTEMTKSTEELNKIVSDNSLTSEERVEVAYETLNSMVALKEMELTLSRDLSVMKKNLNSTYLSFSKFGTATQPLLPEEQQSNVYAGRNAALESIAYGILEPKAREFKESIQSLLQDQEMDEAEKVLEVKDALIQSRIYPQLMEYLKQQISGELKQSGSPGDTYSAPLSPGFHIHTSRNPHRVGSADLVTDGPNQDHLKEECIIDPKKLRVCSKPSYSRPPGSSGSGTA